MEEEWGAAAELFKQASAKKDGWGWAERLQARTLFWCPQALAGVFPFPPKCSDRLVEAAVLINRLPGQSA